MAVHVGYKRVQSDPFIMILRLLSWNCVCSLHSSSALRLLLASHMYVQRSSLLAWLFGTSYSSIIKYHRYLSNSSILLGLQIVRMGQPMMLKVQTASVSTVLLPAILPECMLFMFRAGGLHKFSNVCQCLTHISCHKAHQVQPAHRPTGGWDGASWP